MKILQARPHRSLLLAWALGLMPGWVQAAPAVLSADYHPQIQVISDSSVPAVSSLLGCPIRKVVASAADPVTGLPQKFSFFRWIPRHPGHYSGKVVMDPPTGGLTPLDRAMAFALCSKGMEVALIETWDGYHEDGVLDFGLHERASLRAIAAARGVIEYLGTPVGILGTSLGSIYASLTMGADPRVMAGVFIVGGGPLPEVLTQSDQSGLVALRNTRCEQMGICDPAAYQAELERNISTNPLELADAKRAQDIFMVIGTRDKTVPTVNQEQLWNAWGQPEVVRIDRNHVGTILEASLTQQGRIVRFFSRKLQAPEL